MIRIPKRVTESLLQHCWWGSNWNLKDFVFDVFCTGTTPTLTVKTQGVHRWTYSESYSYFSTCVSEILKQNLLGSAIYRQLVEWQQLLQPWHLVEGHWRTAACQRHARFMIHLQTQSMTLLFVYIFLCSSLCSVHLRLHFRYSFGSDWFFAILDPFGRTSSNLKGPYRKDGLAE